MSKARPITDPIKRNMMIPLHWFAFLDVPITIWLRRESALFDISRPGSPNQRLSLRRAGGFRVRSPSIRARIDRGASAIYDEAVRAHRAGLALPCVFVESVGYSISRNPLFGAIGQWRKCSRAGLSFFAIA